jgi:thymidine phosphorylase
MPSHPAGTQPARLPVEHVHGLHARRLGIDTYQEHVLFMHADCRVCRSEGFEAMSRVRVALDGRAIIATMNVVRSSLLSPGEAGLSESAWLALGAHEGDRVYLSHPEPIESFSAVRAKLYGKPFSEEDLTRVIHDIALGRYSGIETSAFVASCAGEHMSLEESIALTKAMTGVGARLSWIQRPVMDKHSVGGLPGNRTTPIVVAIVASCGLTIPKTSSRAITSPAGTADTMEMLAPVDLTIEHMRRVVEREGGCVVWGGAMALSPADDILIRVERPLDFDSEGQLAASIISKKAAAGSTHLVIDMPVGPSAKVRSAAAAASLGERITAVAQAMGLAVRVVHTDGSQPIGRGIGPALEARDVLAVLAQKPEAPSELRDRAILLAGEVLELGDKAAAGTGARLAAEKLGTGEALRKFEAICEAQGGMRVPAASSHHRDISAVRGGIVRAVDNRKLGKVAKLAGAPRSAAAGLEFHTRIGTRVEAGQPLFTLHAESPGELEYAANYVAANPGIVDVGEVE